MRNTQPNDPAHPVLEDSMQPYYGLTKREYFAALAMQGLASDSSYIAGPEKRAKLAVQCADALINALNEKK